MISHFIAALALRMGDTATYYICWTFFLFPFLLALLGWRLWNFTFRPLLTPDEPKLLPYWIPFIGHAISFFTNPDALYNRGRAYVGGSQESFMLHIAGKRIAVITSPSDVSQVFKDEATFSFDPCIDSIYKGVGNVSDEANIILWRTPEEGFTSLHPNPKGKVLVHTGNALLHKQLLEPKALDELSEKVLGYIEGTMRWQSFFQNSILTSTSDTKVVSLHCWCRDVLIEAQTRAFFGEYLQELEPQMTLIFDQWDINSWMIPYKYPAFMAKAAIQPRDKLIKTLNQYINSPRETWSEGVPFIRELVDEERYAGLSTEDSARILMIILWGINSNVRMTAFWMLAHILQRPSFAETLREEISSAMEAFESPEERDKANLADITRRNLVDACPLLNSAFNEILRVCSTASSLREVVKPGRIGNKYLPVGTLVFLPQRQLLLLEKIFGPNAHEVDLARFATNKSLERNAAYRPFGGGTTLCSGRVLGRREVLAFVALALWRYNMKVINVGEEALGINGLQFPRLDPAKPSIGVSKQVEGDDMILKVTKRNRVV